MLVDLSRVRPDGASVEEIEVIYREGFQRFVRVAQAITRSRESAVDVVQDAFASTLRRRESYRGSGSVESWIWSAVVNRARQAVRGPAVMTLEDPARFEGVSVDAPGFDDEQLRLVIGALPERQRLVLFLRYYADLEYRAIGEALGVEVGTVSATLSQAHRNLRRLVAQVDG
ncbi:MAG: RNA polymerase sigma factor [Nitrososphaerales archaeon]